MNGWVTLTHLANAATIGAGTSLKPTPPTRSLPAPTPTMIATPTTISTPSPTPTLNRSITQVLTTFCDAIGSKDYLTAWNQYTSSLQHAHPQPETFAAWGRYIRCTIPGQSADASALTILTLTLAGGYTDRTGRTGDIDYRFTMSVEQHAWKITKVCKIIAEGCFDVSWG